MPNILFASNNAAHFPTATVGSVANTFDATRVPYAIRVVGYEILSGPVFTPSAGDETWFHFSFIQSNVADTSLTNPFVRAYDSSNRLLFELRKTGSTNQHMITAQLYNGTTSSSVAGNKPMTRNRINYVDIQYVNTSLALEVRVYVNGALAITIAFASNPNSYGKPVRFNIGGAFNDNITDVSYISEIIVADADTRNARLNMMRPSGAGASSQWTGAVSAINDDNPVTGMTTLTAAQRQSMVIESYVGSTNIANVVAVSQTTRGLNSPTKLKHCLRSGGVNYDSADINIDFPLQYNIIDWPINPATSLPWTAAGLSLVESGFLSVA